MALAKDMPDRFEKRTVHAYLRLAGLALDPIGQTATATFLVYQSQAARRDGMDPTGQVTLIADATTTPSYADLAGPRTAQATSIGGLVYGFAKGQDALKGAVDA